MSSEENEKLLKDKKDHLTARFKSLNKEYQKEKGKYSALTTELDSTNQTLEAIQKSIIQTNQRIKALEIEIQE